MNLILFSPRQYETFLVGAQGQTFVPTFMLVLALIVNLSGKSLPTKTLVNAALAHSKNGGRGRVQKLELA